MPEPHSTTAAGNDPQADFMEWDMPLHQRRDVRCGDLVVGTQHFQQLAEICALQQRQRHLRARFVGSATEFVALNINVKTPPPPD